MVGKIFGNRRKHQRRRSAWVGQADFGKLGFNNRNHSENCHHLSLNSKQKICNKIKQRARSASVRALSLPWTDVDFIITTIQHSSPFFSVAAQSTRHICILQVKVLFLKSQLLELSSSPELVELSGPSSSSSSAEERRVYARWSNGEETMLLRLWAEHFDRLESREARKAWDDIAKKMNDKFGTKKTTDKYQKKMKYLVDRYKQAKDWNSK